jgi:soluble P-type ATPase
LDGCLEARRAEDALLLDIASYHLQVVVGNGLPDEFAIGESTLGVVAPECLGQ